MELWFRPPELAAMVLLRTPQSFPFAPRHLVFSRTSPWNWVVLVVMLSAVGLICSCNTTSKILMDQENERMMNAHRKANERMPTMGPRLPRNQRLCPTGPTPLERRMVYRRNRSIPRGVVLAVKSTSKKYWYGVGRRSCRVSC